MQSSLQCTSFDYTVANSDSSNSAVTLEIVYHVPFWDNTKMGMDGTIQSFELCALPTALSTQSEWNIFTITATDVFGREDIMKVYGTKTYSGGFTSITLRD